MQFRTESIRFIQQARENVNPILEDLTRSFVEQTNCAEGVDKTFLTRHIIAMEKIATQMAEKYGANIEVIKLAAWFYDYPRLLGEEDNHDLVGADMARELLRIFGYPEDKIELVYESCKCHRCELHKPRSLEARIIATADSLSTFFDDDFYPEALLYYQRNKGCSEQEALRIITEKMSQYIQYRILFADELEKVMKIFEQWRSRISDDEIY